MHQQNPLHILVVEDDSRTRTSLCNMLELDGHHVETAALLDSCLLDRQWDRVSVVILDRTLADGSAIDILPIVEQLAAKVPVIIMTANPNIEQAVTALRKGAYDYILKPINPDALRARVKRIAEQKQAEKRLEEIELRNRALLDAIPDTILRIRSDGVILDLRTHAESDPTAWPRDIIGDEIRNAPLPADVVANLSYTIGEALTTGAVQIFEYSLAADEEIWSFDVRIVKCGEDEVVAIVRDVTVHKQAVAREMQAERLSAMAQMVAGLAHESRNAFQRSQANLEMLAMEVEDRPEALELVQRIQKAQDYLHYLYEEVNNYAAPIKLNRQKCDIVQVWRDTWAHLEVERRQKDVSLREEGPYPDAICRVDPNALEQVFRNVLENAIIACREPGEISIRCQRTRLAGKAAMEIRVRDDGPGFEADAREKVFEPFFTTKTKGTGLGMAIARRLVEAHGGKITVGEDGGGGAEIVIVLPRGAV